MKNKFLLFAIAGSMILFNACKKETTCINGNGDIIQEQRMLDPFDAVTVIGAFTTSIDQGQNSTVDFFAESNIIPIIRTDVANQQLRIIVQDGNCYNTNQTVEVYVNSPDYREITMDGSGNVSANNLNLDDLTVNLNGSGNLQSILSLESLELSISGSGNANVVGNGTQGNFVVSGSGNIFATNYKQDTAYITISGSGDVRITVNSYLDVTITGSGNVYYKGNPSTVNQNITGSGQLIDEG